MAQIPICLFNKDGTEKPAEIAIADASRATHEDTLLITGAEPTSHTRWREILSRLNENKPKDILLLTNGRAFKTQEDVLYLLEINNLNIFVTPFEADLFLSGDTAGFNLAYSDSLRGITMLLAYNVRVAAMIPILKENNYHLLDMILGLASIGLRNIILDFLPKSYLFSAFEILDGKVAGAAPRMGYEKRASGVCFAALANQPPRRASVNTRTDFDLRALNKYPKSTPGSMPRYSDLHQGVLNAIDSVNFIVHIEGIPPCMLGKESEHASRFFTIYDDKKRQAPLCTECAARSYCPGMYSFYLDEHGDAELAPFIEEIKPQERSRATDSTPIETTAADIAKEISERASTSCLKLSEDEIMTAIKTIGTYKSLWEIIENLGYPIPVAIDIIERLKKAGLAEVIGDNINLIGKLSNHPQSFRSFDNWRLPSDPAYCQLRVRSTDLASRARYIIDSIAAGGRIAVLGDDDFFSLTLAASGHFSEVALFEIDEKISARISEIALHEGLPLVVTRHDLRKPLPARFLKTYDAFYTDSPYSLAGFELFVSRGIQLLSFGGKKHGFASFSCEIPVMEDLELPVQKAINDMGLFIERKALPAANLVPAELKARFSAYESLKAALDNAPANLNEQERWHLACLGRKETLFHFLTTERTKPSITGECTDEIYYEEEPLEFYLKNMN